MENTIPVSAVENLSFLSIADNIRPGQWVLWEVAFDYNDISCLGFLDGCPSYPSESHGDTIEDVEKF